MFQIAEGGCALQLRSGGLFRAVGVEARGQRRVEGRELPLHVVLRVGHVQALEVDVGIVLQEKSHGVLKGEAQLAVHNVVAEAFGVRQGLRRLRRGAQLMEIAGQGKRLRAHAGHASGEDQAGSKQFETHGE